jgi:transcriptional regulator with GAF, ATPase, and Fis domain
VRVICATNRNLVEMMNEHQFRADLFYRLSVFPIELPPLRERPEDIHLLVRHFAMDYAAHMHKRITAISQEFMTAVARYTWPGNIRELQNFIERSVILSTGPVLTGWPPELTHATEDVLRASTASLPITLKQAERSHILQALLHAQGVISGRDGAAARLGLPRTTLIYKMKRLGISFGQNSGLSAPAAASAPISENPFLELPPVSEISDEDASSGDCQPHSDVGRVSTLAEAEREHISEVVQTTNGLIAGKGGAAEVLGLPPSTLRSRMKKLGINSQRPS